MTKAMYPDDEWMPTYEKNCSLKLAGKYDCKKLIFAVAINEVAIAIAIE